VEKVVDEVGPCTAECPGSQCALPWSSSIVQHTVPLTLHFTRPPTPKIATLQPLTVPGMKSDLEFVRHRDEQLSIAIGFESESNLVCSPRVDATKQLSVTNFIAITAALFLATFDHLTHDCVCFWYWYVQYLVPSTPLLECPGSEIVHACHTVAHDPGICLESQFPPSTFRLFGTYSALSGGNGSDAL
jgi:hypothetical protein